MAIRIEWDEFEIALLIEACEEVLRKGKPKSEVVKTVSSNLRKRAISKNIAIDDVFRNENGIALQMQKMAYLLTHGEKGMPGASKLYAEVAELREENPKKFEEILKRAKEEIEMTDLSQQNIDKKALFAQWLNEHPIKKYTPSAIIDALDVASRYCVSKKVCKDGFWSMQNKAEFNAATSKLLSFRLFRLKYRSAAAKMDKAIPLYKAFLDSYVASREENTAEFEGEALNEPDSMLSTAAANSDDIIRLDFSDIGSLIFSKPVCLNYKDHILKLENALLERLKESGLDFVRNGARNHIPGNISVSFKDADGEAILHRLDLMGICVSTGSACDSVSTQISHVLKAIKLKDNYARGTIRISFGKENTFEEANIIAESLIRILKK